jgi:hypothetical protein
VGRLVGQVDPFGEEWARQLPKAASSSQATASAGVLNLSTSTPSAGAVASVMFKLCLLFLLIGDALWDAAQG